MTRGGRGLSSQERGNQSFDHTSRTFTTKESRHRRASTSKCCPYEHTISQVAPDAPTENTDKGAHPRYPHTHSVLRHSSPHNPLSPSFLSLSPWRERPTRRGWRRSAQTHTGRSRSSGKSLPCEPLPPRAPRAAPPRPRRRAPRRRSCRSRPRPHSGATALARERRRRPWSRTPRTSCSRCARLPPPPDRPRRSRGAAAARKRRMKIPLVSLPVGCP